MCSTHFTEYRTNLKHARHGGFQTLDVERRTDSLRPLDRPPGTMTGTDEGRRKTKTETGEDGDGRRRRQTKTETGEDGDRRRRRQSKTKTDSLLGMSEVAVLLQLTTHQIDEDGT